MAAVGSQRPTAAAVGRLKRRPDFLRVADARRKWVAPGLILQAARQGGRGSRSESTGGRDSAAGEDVRVGFTASRKVGNAVARNRAKRRLRAAVAEIMPHHAAPAHDYVVIARAGTLTRPFDDLVTDLATGLRRLGVYRTGDRMDDRGPAVGTERLER